MGIGEDISLESSISVTVIATGFDPNQQQEIIHADPKKIIHSLDGNNEIIQDFKSENEDKKIPLQFDFSSESIDFKNTDLPVTDDLEISTDLSSSQIDINEIEVSFEEVDFEMDIKEDEIEIEDVSENINEIQVVDPELLEIEDQVSLDFDMPLNKHKDITDKIVHELVEDVNEITVNDPIHIIPVSEVDGSDTKKSGFDDYTKLKTVSVSSQIKENKKVLNPLNSSIADGLAKRTEARKIKLKEYNYNFSKAKRISEMEKEPAFKRAGIDLDDVDAVKMSRTNISEDSNGETNLRTNNSFLHDNVD